MEIYNKGSYKHIIKILKKIKMKNLEDLLNE